MIKIYNTMTSKVERLVPIHDNKINLFVCGPTVYGLAHVGNGKTFTQFDMIAKYLRYRNLDVFYLQNITDIDDKIIKVSQERGVSWRKIANLYTREFLKDMKSLGNDAVSQYARATDYISQIVNQVKRLEEKGVAYKTSDGIYYEISKFKNYGQLSGRTNIQETDGVSRIDVDREKRGWNDFCLWKFWKKGEPFWETELGKGRPGWHIEDTAITESYFGPQYDIHGGSVDLKIPHHEAEIAQMEMLSGKSPVVKYWMHTGFLNTHHEKMSKSRGNFWTIRDILKHYNYRVLRLMYLSSHYRSSLEFNEDVLNQNKNALKRLDEFIFKINPDLNNKTEAKAVDKLRKEVISAMDNDFNAPVALAHIYKFINTVNSKGTPGKFIYDYLQEINSFFGFFDFHQSESSEIDFLIRKRNNFKQAKNWQKADEIRKQLLSKGIKLYDKKEGKTSWRRSDR